MNAEHSFSGQWITNEDFAAISPVNVFHRQLDKRDIPPAGIPDSHVLFRKRFEHDGGEKVFIYITADDYFKLYINGSFVTQGPAPAYRFRYGYIKADITPFVHPGENILAVHTLYQGLINRAWVSGDGCHGLIFDIVCGEKTLAKSDESVLCAVHSGFTPLSTVGYRTQFTERYDSRSAEAGFEKPEHDDSLWRNAVRREFTDYSLCEQKTKTLVFEELDPVFTETRGNTLFADLGSVYVGMLYAEAVGGSGDTVKLFFGQELNEDGSVRYKLRANCEYYEEWVLSGGCDALDQYDSKSFRYVEMELPEGCELSSVKLIARHYPFKRAREIKPEYAGDEKLESIYELCSRSIEYGVQEVIQDCMDREKGFYVGDGCYTALAHLILTGDDSIVRKLIDDAFASSFITDTLVTCLDCSHMQEIAEYPLMLISLILWHYRLCGDKGYLAGNYPKIRALLDAYRRDYEKDNILRELDKWCVVEWPDNFRDGYDVDIREGKVCHEAHIAINAYYVEAVRTANKIAAVLGEPPYRELDPLIEANKKLFFDEKAKLFRDGENTSHISFIGNVLALYAGLFDTDGKAAMHEFIDRKGLTAVELFGSVPLLASLTREGEKERIRAMLSDEKAWLNIIAEGGTTTFEGWGKDTKWNTSLFHLTLCLAAVFLADEDTAKIFE